MHLHSHEVFTKLLRAENDGYVEDTGGVGGRREMRIGMAPGAGGIVVGQNGNNIGVVLGGGAAPLGGHGHQRQRQHISPAPVWQDLSGVSPAGGAGQFGEQQFVRVQQQNVEYLQDDFESSLLDGSENRGALSVIDEVEEDRAGSPPGCLGGRRSPPQRSGLENIGTTSVGDGPGVSGDSCAVGTTARMQEGVGRVGGGHEAVSAEKIVVPDGEQDLYTLHAASVQQQQFQPALGRQQQQQQPSQLGAVGEQLPPGGFSPNRRGGLFSQGQVNITAPPALIAPSLITRELGGGVSSSHTHIVGGGTISTLLGWRSSPHQQSTHQQQRSPSEHQQPLQPSNSLQPFLQPQPSLQPRSLHAVQQFSNGLLAPHIMLRTKTPPASSVPGRTPTSPPPPSCLGGGPAPPAAGGGGTSDGALVVQAVSVRHGVVQRVVGGEKTGGGEAKFSRVLKGGRAGAGMQHDTVHDAQQVSSSSLPGQQVVPGGMRTTQQRGVPLASGVGGAAGGGPGTAGVATTRRAQRDHARLTTVSHVPMQQR